MIRNSFLPIAAALLWALASAPTSAQELPQVANATKFSEPHTIPTIFDDAPADLEAVDFDNDGDMDLLWTSRGSSGDAVMWNENLGNGDFALSRIIDRNFPDPRALATGDLNGDGHADVVAGSNSLDQIESYLYYGGTNSIGEAIEVVDIAQGHYNTAILTESGDVRVFGWNNSGVLSPPTFSSPVVDLIRHGYASFSARLEDGSVKSWGYNHCGSRSDSWFSSTTQYSYAYNYGIGLNPDSTLTFNGCNNYGVANLPTDSNFVSVWTSTWDHYWAGAVREDGSVVMWGRDANGNQNVPADLPPVQKVMGGDWWSLALLQDSTLRSWGYNGYSQVSNTPDLQNVVDISVGHNHALALTLDGTLHSWGRSDWGLQAIPEFDSPIVKFGTGLYSSWVITESGRAYMWGYDQYQMTTDANIFADELEAGYLDGLPIDSSFVFSSNVYDGTDVHALDLADIDGDGDLDVVSGGCNDQDVAWYENDGTGQFDGSRHLLAEDIQCITGVLTVDIDLDGDPDVVTYSNSGQLSWFENIAQGNFGPQFLIASWGNGWDVETADLNHDGNPDLVIKDDNGCFQWYANPGPVGDWTYRQEQCPPTGNDTHRAFCLADIIGDDGIDAVTSVWQHGSSSLEISVNRNGYFDETYSAISLPTGGAGLRGLTSADLDNDGDMDLIATNWDGDQVFWLEQMPSTAPTALRTTIDPAATNVLGLAYGDFDGDGDDDLVSADHGKNNVEFYLNDGGTFVGPTTISSVDAYRVETGDINGDGHLDVLVAGGDSDRVEYIPGNGDGTFGDPVTISSATNTVWGVSAADLDNDGDLDVVSASRDDDKFAWYKNLGDGNFGPQQILTILIDQPFDVATSDVDMDGDMDIVGITYEGGHRLIWFENQGGGLFSQYNQIATMGDNPYKLHMADLNGDGTEDALVANIDDDRVSYWPNLGSGNWGSEVVITRHADGCQAVYAADMDGDGDLDVLSASGNDDKVAWYENLGDDTFGMQQPFTIGKQDVFYSPAFAPPTLRGDNYRSVVAFDADGDGDIDVIGGAQNGGIDLYGNLLGSSVGCDDATACNYSAETTASFGCQYDCYGCTQTNAENFNPEATIDDGGCLIPIAGCSNISGIYSLCTDNNVDTIITYCPDDPANAIEMYILSGALENLADYLYVYDGPDTSAALIGSPLTDQLNDYQFQATGPSGCLTIRVVTDVSLSCADGFFNPIKYILSCGYEEYSGCTDTEACNYNPEAIIDDGSCAELDCLGVCGGSAVQDEVCDACVDVDLVISNSISSGAMISDGTPILDSIQSNLTLFTDTIHFELSGMIEEWPIPESADFLLITATGAEGGTGRNNHQGGRGAQISGLFETDTLETLQILVGEAGMNQGYYGSGGGGSFIASNDSPLLVAGGGGGGAGHNYLSQSQKDASTSQQGNYGYNCYSSGTLGFRGHNCHGTAGYGFYDGFLNGGRGENSGTFGGGDFGGYCEDGGGGGGYSGGNGDNGCWGGGAGGGGSFNAGMDQTGMIGVGYGHGSVTIIVYSIVGSNCRPGCMDEGACNYDPIAVEDDGTCEYVTCSGCADSGACNYDETVTIPANDQCEYLTCAGCQDELACNYDADATIDAADCIYAEDYEDCDGNCYNDFDGDGVCDEAEVAGCTYPGADNYDAAATDEDGSCEFAGIEDVFGCVYPTACNFDAAATADDGSCVYATLGYDCDGNCLFDTDGDGICNEYEGCTNPAACNYDPQAQDNDGSCVFPATGYDCDGECLVDNDGDGICDPFEFAGCTDEAACNYYAAATDDDGSCTYPTFGYDCDGYCLGDVDGDGVCDANEIEGCTLSNACNYNDLATDNDGSCVFPEPYRDCDGNCLADVDGDGVCNEEEIGGCIYPDADNFNPDATNDDGSCVFDGLNSVPGCFYSTACNYQPDATVDDGSCVYPPAGYDCDGNCIVDTDGDGVCNQFEVAGCDEPGACNYDATATDNDGTCEYYTCAGCQDVDACNYDPDAVLVGTCDYLSCAGCQDDQACNYDSLATLPADCTFPDPGLDCEGECLVDDNGDGQCDQLPGCTDPLAVNYQPEATDDDGTCIYPCNLCLPVFDVVPEDVTVGCADELPSAPGTYTAYNPCTDEVIDVLALTVTSSMTACSEFITFRYLATNSECGNFTEYTQTYSVLDTIAPEITSLPVGLELSCDDTDDLGDADVVAVDGCTAVSLSYALDTIAGACPSTFTLVRTVTASDVCGNETTGQYSISVVDTTGPVFTSMPADVTLNCEDAWPTEDATAEDNCTTWSIVLEETTQDGDCDGEYTLLRTFKATDACSNHTIAVQTVTFEDVTAPTISSVPADVEYSCEEYIHEDLVTASDLCSDVTRDFSDNVIAGNCPENYTIERTHSATDACGNEATALQVITVVDTVAPVFTSAEPFVATDCTNQSVPLATAVDACGTTTVTFSASPAADPNVPGQELRLYTAADGCGNSVQIIQVVDYADVEACGGCTNATATNYDPDATIDDGSCEFADGYNPLGECISDSDGDGICDPYELPGCQDSGACNYNADATDAGPCEYPAQGYGCDGECLGDADGDGICDANEVEGCTDGGACNYDPFATDEDLSCDYSCQGCTYEDAANYDWDATVDDGTCQFELEDTCPTDLNADGMIGVEDMLEVLGNFGTFCE